MTYRQKSFWSSFAAPNQFDFSLYPSKRTIVESIDFTHKKELISRALDVAIRPTLRWGYFPFYFDKKSNQLSFSWISWSILLCILRPLSTFFLMISYELNSSFYRSIYGKVSETERFTEYSVSMVYICGETLLVIILLYKRKAIIEFFEEFVKLFQKIDENIFNQYFQYIKRLNLIITATFLFETLKTIFTQFSVLINKHTELEKGWSILYYVIPLSSAIWVSYTFHRLFARVWIISIVQCFLIVVNSIKNNIQECLEAQEKQVEERRTKLEESLRNYRKLEAVVQKFNKLLGPYITIALLSVMITVLMNTFETILYAKYGKLGLVVDFASSGIVNFIILYGMCSSGTQFENEV